MKKFLIMMLIVISVLGISSCFAKSMTTADFEALVKKCGYEDFGSLSDYTLDNNSTTYFVKYLNTTYGKSIIRYFDENGHALYTKFYVHFCKSGDTNRLLLLNNDTKYNLKQGRSGNSYSYNLDWFEIDIENKTVKSLSGQSYSPYCMDYNNFSALDLDVFKSKEIQRIIMKTVIAWSDTPIHNSASSSTVTLLNPRTSKAITTTTYNDIEYKGSISYDAYFNKFYFTFTSGWDLTQDYNFYLERFEIQEDDTLEAKEIYKLTNHNPHNTSAERGLYGFNGQHGTDVFPLEESFEVDLVGVDTSQKYVYRVCVGSVTDNADNTVSSTPFIASDLLVFNENTLYTYPYFKFDYSYIEILKVSYDPDYTDPTEPDNPDNPDTDKDYTNIIKDVGDKISDKLEETKTGIINGIIDGIKGLFIPSEDFFESYWEDLSTFMKSKLGFLWEIITFIPNLFQNIIDVCQSALEVYIVEIPEISVPLGDEEYVILESFTFNVYEYFNQNDELLNLYTLYLNIIDFLVGFALVSYALSVIQDIFGIHLEVPEHKNRIGFYTDE